MKITNLEKPLLSVIVPCYNQEKYLAETLSSVLNQQYNNWECLIIDDGSTDTSSEIAKKFTIEDNRFKLFVTENQGVANARNFGIHNSQGEFILPLDGDDLIGNNYLTDAINAFKGNPNLKVVYSKVELIGSQNGIWNLEPFNLKNLLRSNMIFCSGVFKKTDFEKTQGYDPNLKEGLEDWDFWIQLLKNGGEVIQLPDVHFYYRMHEIKTNSRNGKITLEIEMHLRKKIYEKHRSSYELLWPPHQVIYDYKQLNEQILSTKFLIKKLWHAGWRKRINL